MKWKVGPGRGIRREDRADRGWIQRIGETVGRILLEREADAVMIVGTNEQKLPAAELELGSFGRVITSHANIAGSGHLDRILAEIDCKFTTVDLLVNSAHVFFPNHSWNTPEKTTIDT